MKSPISTAQLMLRRAGQAVAGTIDFSKLNISALKKERDRVVARVEARNPPITRVLSVPRPIRLAGQIRVAEELEIEDLARIQAWLEEQVPHPLDSFPPEWADPEPETRTRRLAAIWEAAGSWPVRYGTAAASKLLAGREGRAYFSYLCLRRNDPGFGLLDALHLVDSMTALEWAALRRVAFNLTPREEIADELAPDTPGKTANWCLSIHRASQHPGGPSYDTVRRWKVSQWRNFCAEGKAVEFSETFGAQASRVRGVLDAALKPIAGDGEVADGG